MEGGRAMNLKHQKGFTLIELLVIVAIIGLLSSIISTAVNISRVRARDAKRVQDLKQVKAGMDLYLNTGNGYPDTGVWVPGTLLLCGTVETFKVPSDPSPLYAYTYAAGGTSNAGCGGTVRSTWTLQFYVENKGGYYHIDQDGVVRTGLSGSGGAIVSLDSLVK